MRIVSLLPSATEIVCALGLVDELAAISGECDWPPEIVGKPVLDEVITPSALASARFDRVVRQQVHNGRSVYHVDEQQLAALKPDLILTHELCQVCAPAFDDVTQVARIVDQGVKIVSLEPNTLNDILQTISLVGHLTGKASRAQGLVQQLVGRIERVQSRAELVETRPRVLCLEWFDPLCVAGRWVPDLVELAGGDTFGASGEPAFVLSWEEFERFNPEVIVLMPRGLPPRHLANELEVLSGYEGWDELAAVKRDRVYLVHGPYYFSRPGPRVLTGLEILAKAFHPKLFSDIELPQRAMYKVGR